MAAGMSNAYLYKQLAPWAVQALSDLADLGIEGAELRMRVPAEHWPFHGDQHRVWARGGEFVFVRVDAG